MANDVSVEIGLDSTAFQKEMEKMAKSVSSLGDTINQNFSGKINGALKTFQGTLGGLVAFRGLEIVADQFRKLGEEIGRAIDVAERKEANLTRLNFALTLSGRGATKATKEFSDFADEIERTTKFTDDQALASITLLANTTNLSNKGLKEATKASADLATVMGVDLESATQSLAKAQQGHLDRLLKNTLHIREGNNASETWANTLNRLATLQGSAGATLDTYTGKTDQLAKAQENVQEAVGNIIIKNSQVLGFLQALREQLDGVEQDTIASSGSLSESLSDAILYTLSFAKAVTDVADIFGRAFSIIYNAVVGSVKGIVVALNSLFIGIADVIGGFVSLVDEQLGNNITSTFDGFRQGTAELATSTVNDFKDIGNAITGDTYLSKLSSNLDTLGNKTAEYRTKEKKASEDAEDERVQKAYATDRAILESRAKLEADINAIVATTALERKQLTDQLNAPDLTNELDRKVKEIEDTQAFEDEKLNIAYLAEVKKNAFIKDEEEKRLTNLKAFRTLEQKQEENASKAKLAMRDVERQRKAKIEEAEVTATGNFIQAGLVLASEGSAIQKGLMITQAIVNTYAGATRALADYPAPASFAVAGSVIALGLANVAKISGAKFEKGGIVGGNSNTGDNIGVAVNSGEMILNRQQQAELFRLAQGNGGATGLDSNAITAIVNAIKSTPIIVQANGREIARLVREESRSGFSFSN